MIRTKIKSLFEGSKKEGSVCVAGWVRTKRISKEVIFITLNDGSTLHNLQIVSAPSLFSALALQRITTGTSLFVQGHIVCSVGSLQNIELQASEIKILGSSVGYPLQPKKHSNEFLREITHLRFRTTTFGAVFRIRHAVSYAIHQFFYQRGFVYLHAPVITSADAEGAGEMFRVTALDLNNMPKAVDGGIDFKQDFFNQPAYLTVSGQLAAEAAVMGLAEVYTFGPTFRAENSNTSRHLAEFWMVEPEVAFNDLKDNMILAEEFLKYILRFVFDHCKEDLKWLHQRTITTFASQGVMHRPLLDRLECVLSESFACITYGEALEILIASLPNRDGTFVFPIQGWGSDLKSEHERYLVENHFKKPVIVIDYPKEMKPFYMRQNDDGITVAAMDILFPGIGELVGGSQREERLDKLSDAIFRMNIEEKTLQWYLETRRFGTVPHSGFGLGLERLVQFVTGMDNIRDVIPFPRTPGNAVC